MPFFFYRWSDCDMKCSTEIGTFNCLEFTYISYELCERSTYSKADNFCFDDLLNVSVYLSVSHCVFVCVLFYFLFHSQHCHFVASTRQKFQFTHAFLATMSLFLFYFLCFFKISFLSYLCINSFTFFVVVCCSSIFHQFFPFNWDKYLFLCCFFINMCWFTRNFQLVVLCLRLKRWEFSFSYKSLQMLISFYCLLF